MAPSATIETPAPTTQTAAPAAVPAPAAAAPAPAPTPAPAPAAPAAPAANVPGQTAAPAVAPTGSVLSDTPVQGAESKATAAAATDAAKAAAAAPADYTLAAPTREVDGKPVALLPEPYVAERAKFFKQSGLTEAQAKAMIAGDAAQLSATADALRSELMKHGELGGLKLDQTIATTKSVLAQHLPQDIRAQVAQSVFANHWVLHHLCAVIARLTPTEDVAPQGAAPQKAPPSAAQAMFPHLYAKK